MSKNPHNHGMRTDIQALRALAIVSVVVFHIWPTLLTGGFVGVDIFFVISGFLITGQLWRQEQATGKVNFKDFWSRRARRLLPASMLAIALTTIATFVFTTPSWFIKVHDESYGSILYVQNWELVRKVTNYLTDDGTKSPFQHFWSLSVEEQYYIFWPVLLFVVLWVSKYFPKFLKNKTVLLAILALMLVSSLWYSIWLTYTQPENAYFNTFTRVWEFAAGAILAIATAHKDVTAAKRNPIYYWVGAALMVYAICYFTTSTPFPSWYAAIPVLGTLLVLHGGASSSKLVPQKLLALKPIQFMGDISYSLYLWHWPILILAPWILLNSPNFAQNVWVLVISIAVAWLSKRFVEDPIRFGWLSRLKPTRQLLAAALTMLVLVALTFSLNQFAKQDFKTSWGSSKLTPPLTNLAHGGAQARDHGGCEISREGTGFSTCLKGDQQGTVRVALIGDSHTRQWFVPLDDLAYKYHWQITYISKSACSLVDPQMYPANLTHYTCQNWNSKLLSYLATQKPFDLIINSNSSLVTQGRKDVGASFASMVKKLTANGHTKFLLIHDSPKPRPTFVPCIEQWGPKSPTMCAVTRAAGLTPADPMPAAITGFSHVISIDLTNKFCSLTKCSPVIGNIVVYRDNSHITTTWAKHLEPALAAAIPAEFKK